MIKEGKGIDFGAKKHTPQGIISCSLFLIELVIFLISIIVSYQASGNAGLYIGILGVLISIIAVVGAYYGYLGLRVKERVQHKSAGLGLIMNLLTLIGMTVLYIYGSM
ncbi:MAG: DUF6142 family protein [Lachnospiraceae bacterium]